MPLLRALALSALLWLVTMSMAFSEQSQGWIDTQVDHIEELIMLERFDEIDHLSLTGGVFWHRLPYDSNGKIEHVIDFSSSTSLRRYDHYAVNSEKEIVWHAQGGIEITGTKPYFLRHGQDLDLPIGNYLIYTRLESPFLSAQTTPQLYDQESYQLSIQRGNTLTLVSLGIFIALGFYYFTLGIATRQLASLLYAIFITGNFVFFSTALNVNSAILGVPWFLPIGQSLIFSNIANIAFVMVLLKIKRRNAPRFFAIGISLIVLLLLLILVAFIAPRLSLECSRIGVAAFAIYGFAASIKYTLRGSRVARVYLLANILFITPAMLSIWVQSITQHAFVIEYIGIIAVSIEALMLALVISYQTGLVYIEKKAGLLATEEALQSANQALKSKERFLANVSHELRTPLNAIQGASSLLEEEQLSESGHEYLNIIEHSSSLLLFLINDILDLSKINTHKLKIHTVDFNIRNNLSNIEALYQNLARNKSLTFTMTISSRVPVWLHADDKRLEQVLINLISNAFKFTEQGSVDVLVDLKESNLLYIEIVDTGIGIPKDQHDNIFTDFTQGDSSIARNFGGTGLGLPISAKIVSLMGGQLDIDRSKTKGSRFFFTIPVTSNSQQPKAKFLSPKKDLSTLSIVVVDDNEVNLKIMAGLLKKLQVDYSTFLDADGAIRYLESNSCDLVLMDIQMPNISGLEACEILRSAGFNKPIIALTANASDEDRLAAQSVGMNDFLAKPVKYEQLEALFLQLINEETHSHT